MLKRLFEQNEKTVASPARAQFLVFKLGGEEYGVDFERVRELRGYDTATPVPGSKAYIKGVINLRGALVPIVDMRIKLNIGTVTYDQFTSVIVLSIADRLIAAIVDSVSNLVSIAPEQIDNLSRATVAPVLDTLKGVSALANRLVHLIDIDALYSSIDFGLIERLISSTTAVPAGARQLRTADHAFASSYLWAMRGGKPAQVSALKFRPHWRPVPK